MNGREVAKSVNIHYGQVAAFLLFMNIFIWLVHLGREERKKTYTVSFDLNHLPNKYRLQTGGSIPAVYDLACALVCW